MKISILTTITNPVGRQDKWEEAFACYMAFTDEVVAVDGSEYPSSDKRIGKLYGGQVKVVYLHWPYEWNWIELPKHLNAGLRECTGDWVIKLDIDQFIHENDFKAVRRTLADCSEDIDVTTFQKMSMTFGKKYYQKGPTPIAFRRKPNIVIGKDRNKKTDLCFAINQETTEEVNGYDLPVGTGLKMQKGGQSFWNYDYFFKTKEFTSQEFFRFSRAYHRFYGSWQFGRTEEDSFQVFLEMMKGRHERAPYTYKPEDHPKWIRKAVSELTEEQFGHSAWGLCK